MTNGVKQDGAPVIRVTDLSKVFRDFWGRPRVRAVNGISLEIARGEVFGLLGPNGSGKSTTLKLILGLLHPSGGKVELLGRSPREVAMKSCIGYMPEETYLYRYLTARETLAFYGKLFDLPAEQRRERVEQLLDMIGLQPAADRAVGEFSKGMARLVCLAQALVNNPELVILDEPTAGLDPIGRRKVKDLILTLAKGGKTVLVASHLLADIEDVCGRIAILCGGRILVQGSVGSLLAQPDSYRLTAHHVSPETLKNLLAAARQQLGAEPEIERTAWRLEEFFLQVVRDAGKGDTGSGGIAPYLAGDGGRGCGGKCDTA